MWRRHRSRWRSRLPAIGGAEFEARIAALLAAVDADWIVVYGDREHAANLIFLCNLDPRFEEALLVIGPQAPDADRSARRTSATSRSCRSTSRSCCCPTFSLMGIDRSGGPTLEEALRETGIGAGARIGVVGWKALQRRGVRTAACRRSSRPRSSSTRSETSPESPAARRRRHAALTSPRSGLRSFCSAPTRSRLRMGRLPLLGVGARDPRRRAPGRERARRVPRRPSGRASRSACTRCSPPAPTSRSVCAARRSRRLELGDAAVACIGLWGGNCARGGLVAASTADLTARRARAIWSVSRSPTGGRWPPGTRRSPSASRGGEVFGDHHGAPRRRGVRAPR